MGKFCWVKTIFSLPFHSQQSPKRQIFTIGIIKCLNFWNFSRKHKSQTVTFATAQKCIKHCSFQLVHLLSFADYFVKKISQLRTWYQSFDVRQCRLHKNSCHISNIIKTECYNAIQAWESVCSPWLALVWIRVMPGQECQDYSYRKYWLIISVGAGGVAGSGHILRLRAGAGGVSGWISLSVDRLQ